MPGGRRGLVAPQNTFLENIIRRSSSQQISSSRRQETISPEPVGKTKQRNDSSSSREKMSPTDQPIGKKKTCRKVKRVPKSIWSWTYLSFTDRYRLQQKKEIRDMADNARDYSDVKIITRDERVISIVSKEVQPLPSNHFGSVILPEQLFQVPVLKENISISAKCIVTNTEHFMNSKNALMQNQAKDSAIKLIIYDDDLRR